MSQRTDMLNPTHEATVPDPASSADHPASHPAGGGDGVVSIRTLLGATIRNREHEPLGRVEDAAIDAELGTLAYALLAYRDVAGRIKRFVVPWSAMRFDEGDGSLVVDLDADVLERAPGLPRLVGPLHPPDSAQADPYACNPPPDRFAR
jgi:hypothetical protein